MTIASWNIHGRVHDRARGGRYWRQEKERTREELRSCQQELAVQQNVQAAEERTREELRSCQQELAVQQNVRAAEVVPQAAPPASAKQTFRLPRHDKRLP